MCCISWLNAVGIACVCGPSPVLPNRSALAVRLMVDYACRAEATCEAPDGCFSCCITILIKHPYRMINEAITR